MGFKLGIRPKMQGHHYFAAFFRGEKKSVIHLWLFGLILILVEVFTCRNLWVKADWQKGAKGIRKNCTSQGRNMVKE